MSFEKTYQDLIMVRELSPNKIDASTVLSLMLDVLMDLGTATNSELSLLAVNEECVAAWLTVCRALVAVPVEEKAQILSSRRLERLVKLRRELERVTASVSECEAQHEELNTYIKALKEKNNILNVKKTENKKLELQKQELESNIESLEIQLSEFHDIDIQVLLDKKSELARCISSNASALEEVERTDKELSEAKIISWELNDKLVKLKIRKEELGKETQQLQKDNAELSAQCDKMENTIRSLNEEIRTLQLMLSEGVPNDLKQQRDSLQKKAKEVDAEQAGLLKSVQQLNEQISSQAEENDFIRKAIDDLKTEISCLESERQNLSNTVSEYEVQKKILSDKLSELEKDVLSSQDAIEKTKKHVKEKEAELHKEKYHLEQLQNDLKNKSYELSKMIEEEASVKRIFEEKTNACEQLQQEVDNLKLEIYVLEERQSKSNRQLLELQKEQSRKKLENQYLKDDIDKANDTITRLEKGYENLKVQTENAKYNRSIAESDLQRAENNLNELNDEIQFLKEKVIQLESQVKNQETEKQNVEISITNLTYKGAELQQQIDELNKQMDDLNSEVAKTKQIQKDLESQKDDRETQKQKLNDKISVLREKSDELKQNIEESEKKVKKLERDIEKYDNECTEYQKFFDSEDCKRKQEQISKYRIILDLYRDGIQQLFGTNPPVENLNELVYEYDLKKSELSKQLQNAQDVLRNLSANYTEVIIQIEKRVNL